MFTDLPLPSLHAYRFDGAEPEDFDAFWAETLAAARAAAAPPVLRRTDNGLLQVDTHDVTFSGFDGQPVRAWLRLPRGVRRPLPAVVEYLGYGCARGTALRPTLWSSLGYAHLLMDNRGQSSPYGAADTPDGDIAPQVGGVLTRGLAGPEHHYYRRLFTDAVRAVDTVAALDDVDPGRIAVVGSSQGGGIAIAAAALHPGVAGACVDVPFLCHFRRATHVTDAHPYRELTDYLQGRPAEVERAFATLSYLDGANHAARATAPVRFSVALMDPVCPPSTVFAAYHRWGERAGGADKDIRVWEYAGHEGGGDRQLAEHAAFVARVTAPAAR
ncbi:acetylxylan esterase [Kitasatospora fiedleri]|uniref:acetylxylan esterase n=1 Tax=Kitasatospora fiedleri TaxID=2991545 RepID=UPI00249B076B|nr:acetylxylan esterase [Kitasatospora fiedleri]